MQERKKVETKKEVKVIEKRYDRRSDKLSQKKKTAMVPQ